MGTMHFSTMDFKSRFWQVKIVYESHLYTTFTLRNLGFYEFTHVPFGLCNALVTFQCLVQNMLGELNLTYCNIYLEDMIVFGRTEEEHLEHLHIVFEWCCKFNLKLKLYKCSFFQSKITYLVHHVFHKGICPSKENVFAVEEFPMPETVIQVHTFCGLAGHYRHFIKGFCKMLFSLIVRRSGFFAKFMQGSLVSLCLSCAMFGECCERSARRDLC